MTENTSKIRENQSKIRENPEDKLVKKCENTTKHTLLTLR